MSATKKGITDLALPDMERRLANTIRYGKVLEVNHATKRVRIKSGNIETDWLRWPASSANSRKRRWDPPTIGEQVCMLAPTGDLTQATFIPGMYQSDHDAPSADPNEDLAEYNDGAVISYNVSTHKLTANLQSETSIIADRTSIKATRGAGSVEVKDTEVKAAVGSASITITETTITLTVAGSTISMNSAGITQTGAVINLN